MSITHKFVSAIADGADTSVVRPSNWNDTHQIDNSTITEAMLSIADNTTGNVSTSAHGFAPKVTNTANYLKGDGTWSSPGSNSGPTFPGGIPMTGVTYPTAYNVSVSTGNTDLYTAPALKRAMVVGMMLMNNSGVGNIGWFPELKSGGVYYQLNNTQTTANAARAQSLFMIILEPGESISVNTATNNGAFVSAEVVEFDSSISVFSSKITSFSAPADNTVYTVTSGKKSIVLSTSAMSPPGAGQLNYVQTTGNTFKWKLTPSGGSATVISGTSTSTGGTVTGVSFGLSSGDAILLNLAAATNAVLAWVNVMEI